MEITELPAYAKALASSSLERRRQWLFSKTRLKYDRFYIDADDAMYMVDVFNEPYLIYCFEKVTTKMAVVAFTKEPKLDINFFRKKGLDIEYIQRESTRLKIIGVFDRW